MASTLVALFGPKRGVRLLLDGPTVVGRSSSASLQLIDGKVSREHCRFLIEDGGVVLEDLGSQNGTFVNGAAITGRRVLVEGDEIAVGDSLFLLDPDFAVLAARYGDATLVVSDAAGDSAAVAAGAAPATDSERDGAGPAGVAAAVGALARALAAAASGEAAVEALLATSAAWLDPERTFVLGVAPGAAVDEASLAASSSASWPSVLRVLGGRGQPASGGATPAGGGSDPAPVLSRAVLAAAARQRAGAPLALAAWSEERARGEGRSLITRAPRALLVAPLQSGDTPIGFLYLDRRAERPWSEGDLALAGALAAVAGLHRLGGALSAPQLPGAAAPPATSAGATASPSVLGPVGDSPAFARVRQLAAAAARTTSTVLITGETGTGKEEVARHLHRLAGRGPFVAVNCGAIPEALAESELFGHERGAFTGAVAAREGRIEAADGGTLFLDEVGELSLGLQVKLLRVLQERVFQRVGSSTPRSVSLRVVAATHRRLESEVAAGRFRDDLYYRLNVVRVEIPPLRDRREDIGPLAVTLLGRVAARLGCADPGLEPAAREALAGAAWPGNARELANVLERVLVLRDPAARGPLRRAEIAAAMGETTAPALVPAPPPGGSPGPAPGLSSGASSGASSEPAAPAGEAGLTEKVAALERAEILAALRAARGVKARAAKQLGISRPTLDKKMTDLGIDLWSEGHGDGA